MIDAGSDRHLVRGVRMAEERQPERAIGVAPDLQERFGVDDHDAARPDRNLRHERAIGFPGLGRFARGLLGGLMR